MTPTPEPAPVSTALLPCPFCGEAKRLLSGGSTIYCGNCKAAGPMILTNAGEDWNTRADTATAALQGMTKERDEAIEHARLRTDYATRLDTARGAALDDRDVARDEAALLREQLEAVKIERDDAKESQRLTQQARQDDSGRLQQKCSDWGTYWRASDAHGVNLNMEQAVEILQDALGVEVEIAAAKAAPVSQERGA